MTEPHVDVFAYLDYRSFMADFVQWKKDERGLTFRYFAQKAGLNSPNYLQQVINGKRNLSPPTAAKIADGFALAGRRRAYFVGLVELASATSEDARQASLDELKSLVAKAKRQPLNAPSLHASWLHPIVWELAGLSSVDMRPEALAESLRYLATSEQIAGSLGFLVAQGWLEAQAEPHRYAQRPIDFEPLNDVRRVELQQCHLRYLEVAKRRLSDDLGDREFQALTLAMPRAKMPEVKALLRAFVVGLNERFSQLEDADSVLQLECAAFFLTRAKGP